MNFIKLENLKYTKQKNLKSILEIFYDKEKAIIL